MAHRTHQPAPSVAPLTGSSLHDDRDHDMTPSERFLEKLHLRKTSHGTNPKNPEANHNAKEPSHSQIPMFRRSATGMSHCGRHGDQWLLQGWGKFFYRRQR